MGSYGKLWGYLIGYIGAALVLVLVYQFNIGSCTTEGVAETCTVLGMDFEVFKNILLAIGGAFGVWAGVDSRVPTT